jgi:hypothetical protein
MDEIQQRRILYAADRMAELYEILGEAAEKIMAELETLPSNSTTNVEDAEYEAAFAVMAFVERLDKDLEILYAVKQFPATSAKKSSEVSLFKKEV